ncbi:MAG: carboxypeptidase-like regulatory domain-containing protein [Planctomycetota bacterium]
MGARRRRRRGRRLLLLLLLAVLLPIGGWVAGILPGGGRSPTGAPSTDDAERRPFTVTLLRSEDRSPIAGARISVRSAWGESAHEGASDERGRARFERAPPGPLRVDVSAPGRRRSLWTAAGPGADITLVVPPGRVRRGRVRRPDGSPVRGRVHLLGASGRKLAQADTDADGRFRIVDHPSALYVCIEPEDGAPAVTPLGEDLVVERGKEVRGRLLGARGGRLEVFIRLVTPEDVIVEARARWKVAGDGSFVGHLPPDATAWALYGGAPLSVREGEIPLPRRVAVRGRVAGPRGAPAPGAQVEFHPYVGGDFPVPVPPRRVVTGPDGSFAVDDLSAGRYEVAVHRSGCRPFVVDEYRTGSGDLDIRLRRGHRLRGRVQAADGTPVEGAFVLAFLDGDWRRDVTDHQGVFVMAGLPETVPDLRVVHAGFGDTSLQSVSTHDELVVTLRR